MYCCCHVWAGAHSCCMDMLHRIQKRVCRAVAATLAASLEPLGHKNNAGILSFIHRYYFGRCSSELAELVPLSYSRGRSTLYSDRLHDFPVTISRSYKNVYATSFFTRIAKLWTSLPAERFQMTYDLNSFKGKVNRHFLSLGSF